jgi:nucleotide-binding universal stress UspA family protein
VEQELDKWAGAARDKGISARTFVRMGSPYQEIVDLATDEHADLVVIGTHGRSVVSRLLSAAWRIA